MKFKFDIFEKEPHAAKNEPLPEIPAELVESTDSTTEKIQPSEVNTEITIICPDCKRKVKSPVKNWPVRWGPRPQTPEDRERSLIKRIESFEKRDQIMRETVAIPVAEAMLCDDDSPVSGQSILAAMDRDGKESFLKMAYRALFYIREKRYFSVRIEW